MEHNQQLYFPILHGYHDLEVNPAVDREIAKCQLKTDSYTVISVLGAQHTGKSTILNEVFGTHFAVAQQQGRTTVGINACALKDRDLLLLDVEGSDSRERKNSHVRASKQLACFAMCLSDLVIVNIKTDEVSRDSAGLVLIQQIRESVGQLRGMNERPVKIIVLLRDFQPKQHRIGDCSELIHSEL